MEDGAYFNERGITHMKFQNFVIFFLEMTKNNYYYVSCVLHRRIATCYHLSWLRKYGICFKFICDIQ